MVKYLAIFFLLCAVLVSCARMGSQPETTTEKALPLLHIQPSFYKLGDIREGEAAIATFLIRNNSSKSIELMDIQTSCGCTAAEPDSFVIMPYSFTQLRVAVDTTAKESNIKKSIRVTDNQGHTTSAILSFNVISNPHMVKEGKVKGIFDGKCASCHFEPLLKKQSALKLYEVGCAMCHGEDANGAYAPSLRNFHSIDKLKLVITKGVGKPQMPGFSRQHGGPLDGEQIDALAAWLMSLRSPK